MSATTSSHTHTTVHDSVFEAEYQPHYIETLMQQHWATSQPYRVANDADGATRYILSMFPYPSGKLHMGHVRNYTIGDVLSRYYRLKGDTVLQPMGWDAFGLPAENAAIAHQVSPHEWTTQNIDYMRTQLQSLGLSIDWTRELATCEPDYYRWEQWLFTRLYKRGLVYKKLATVNWDPVDNCVLANEQVVEGRGWRSGAEVEKRDIEMYYFRITDYAQELLDDLDKLEGHWPPQVITMQRNWIGRSEGMEVAFALSESTKTMAQEALPTLQDEALRVYTTRPDTLMGVTYVAIAAEHPLALAVAKDNADIADFVHTCRTGSVKEADIASMDKQGMDTGLSVIHPLTGETLPIWVANYVLMSYGSGAVMAVPAHDERDYDFANQYDLPIKTVIQPSEDWQDGTAYTDKGTLINSDRFDGMSFEQVFAAILQELEPKGMANKQVNYRLRDWGVSRQRYWGCPIPIIHCDDCGSVPVPEDQLPVVLPTDIVPDGRGNPLIDCAEFVNTTCPNCQQPARRETDTFDTFVESSWYYARFASPHCDTAMLDKTAADNWLPVDQYIGGIEHAVMHLLYARFFHKLMRDEGLVIGDEPFANLLTQGMVLAVTFHRDKDDGSKIYYRPDQVDITYDDKGIATSATLKEDGQAVVLGGIEKMSKSKNNGVDPQQTIDNYGADTARLFTLASAPADHTLEWSDGGLKGAHTFLKRLWRLTHDQLDMIQQSSFATTGVSIDNTALAELDISTNKPAKALRRKLHETIAAIDSALGERLALNTPVAALMELYNEIKSFSVAADDSTAIQIRQEVLVKLLIMLAPYAPHAAEYLLLQMGYDINTLSYPHVDDSALVQDTITMAVQINGKVRGELEVAPDSNPETLKQQARQLESVAKFITGEIKKEIVVPNKLINIVVAK